MADANADAQAADAPKKNLGKLMLPLFAVLNLAVVGGGAFLVFKSTLGYKPKTLTEPTAEAELKKSRRDPASVVDEKVMFTMPPFTINLAGQPRRLLRVEMTFEMLDKEGFEEIVRNSPRARDEIMRILNRKSFDDLETIQGKLFLKDQVAVTLNQSLRSGVVKDIYFNEFIIQ